MYSCIIFKLKKHGYGSVFKNLVTPLCHSPCVPFGFTQIISFLNVKLRSSIIFWTSALIAFILSFDIAVPMLIQTNLPGSITLFTSLSLEIPIWRRGDYKLNGARFNFWHVA